MQRAVSTALFFRYLEIEIKKATLYFGEWRSVNPNLIAYIFKYI